MPRPPDLPNEIYSQGLDWPWAYRRLWTLGLTNLTPWRFLEAEELAQTYREINERFPGRHVVPFARVDDADIACFTVLVGYMEPRVLLIHANREPGYEVSLEFPNFWDWFRLAIDDFIEAEQQGQP